MADIDVTRLVSELDPFDLSASIAERGANAGPETWANAKSAATEQPLDIQESDLDSIKTFFQGFGAWDEDEIAAWSRADLDALILQFAAGDLREVQSLCPGDGLGDVDWDEAQAMAEAGTIGGNLYTQDDRLYIGLYS